MEAQQAEQLLKELEILKKIKIIELLDQGHAQSDIAQLIGVSQPTISRMIPSGMTKAKKKNG